MLGRPFKTMGPSPSDRMELAVTYNGKTYTIVPDSSMEEMAQVAEYRFRESNPQATDSEAKAAVSSFLDNCDCSTIERLLGRMTPAERLAWKNSYRFTPITRNIK